MKEWKLLSNTLHYEKLSSASFYVRTI